MNFLPFLIAPLAGVAHAYAFAPRQMWWLQVAALALLFVLVRHTHQARRAAWLGGLFGFGWFCSGVWWLYISMHVYGGMPAAIAGAAVALLSAYLALYPALACALLHRLLTRPPRARLRDLHGFALALAAGGVWGLSEWLRGSLLSGFPWLASGYAHSDGPLAGFAPLLGVYGISALTGLLAWCAAVLLVPVAAAHGDRYSDYNSSRIDPGNGTRLTMLALLVVIPASGWLLDGKRYTEAAAKPLRVRLLQGNISQDLKFQPEQLDETIRGYTELITAQPADLVVTPETAYPLILQQLPGHVLPALQDFSTQSGTHILFGAAGSDGPDRYTNSAFGIAPQGQQTEDANADETAFRYDKHHLVPFGEFIPTGFHWFVRMMNMPMGEFLRGAVVQPPFPVNGQGAAVNICYEDLFGEEIARTLRESPAPASVLVNITNLAWFGNTVALDQHLQIARMRALETQRPMLRATNTGVTAIIAADGRVQSRLPNFERAVLTGVVQGSTGLTPYIRLGNLPTLAAALAFIAMLVLVTRRRTRSYS